jgi:hypothetical protein
VVESIVVGLAAIVSGVLVFAGRKQLAQFAKRGRFLPARADDQEHLTFVAFLALLMVVFGIIVLAASVLVG